MFVLFSCTIYHLEQRIKLQNNETYGNNFFPINNKTQ